METKFQLKRPILNSGTKVSLKGLFSLKTEEVSTTTEFCMFKLVYKHFHKILKLFDVLPNFPFTTNKTMRDYW